MDLIPFLTEDIARSISQHFGTPVFVYDQKALEHRRVSAFGTNTWTRRLQPAASTV
jgi:diaminopimelate decarboxylase